LIECSTLASLFNVGGTFSCDCVKRLGNTGEEWKEESKGEKKYERGGFWHGERAEKLSGLDINMRRKPCYLHIAPTYL
jgi:hypothetical protein